VQICAKVENKRLLRSWHLPSKRVISMRHTSMFTL